MPLNDQIANLVNNTGLLLDTMNVSKQKIENAVSTAEAAVQSHKVETEPHNQYLEKVQGLSPAFFDNSNRLVNSQNQQVLPEVVLPNSPVTLAVSGLRVTLTGTTNETALYAVDIPDQIMGPNSALRIEPVWTYTNSSNIKRLRVRIGTDITAAASYERDRTTSQFEAPLILLINRGMLNSQINVYSATANYATANTAGTESLRSFDFSQSNMKIFITGQLTNASEEMALQSLVVTVFNPRA